MPTPPVLTVPGLWNSGPQHWQTYWEAKHADWRRVAQRDWDRPDRAEWVAALQQAAAAQPRPPVLAAHSLGCCLVAQWAADTGGRGVAGAFLVAPSDVEAPGYPAEGRSFSSMPRARLPFPSVVVASTDDEYVRLDRATEFAAAWGSELVVIGAAGHVNGASGFGPWPEGESMLLRLCESLAGVDPRARIRESYDAAAEGYADKLFSELDGKPLDRHLLNRFSEALRGRGKVADLGCGPGHVARYLRDHGLSVVGIDLAPEMVRVASKRTSGIEFRTGDMGALDLPEASLAGIVAFYAIVHHGEAELAPLFAEWHRVLRPGGLALIAFHAGDELVHVDELFGAAVSLDFRFHAPHRVIRALRGAGFRVLEDVRREPYPGAEFPSRRCYLLAER